MYLPPYITGNIFTIHHYIQIHIQQYAYEHILYKPYIIHVGKKNLIGLYKCTCVVKTFTSQTINEKPFFTVIKSFEMSNIQLSHIFIMLYLPTFVGCKWVVQNISYKIL